MATNLPEDKGRRGQSEDKGRRGQFEDRGGRGQGGTSGAKEFPNSGMFGQILTNEQSKVGGEVSSREKEHGC